MPLIHILIFKKFAKTVKNKSLFDLKTKFKTFFLTNDLFSKQKLIKVLIVLQFE
jgi:hypothetical protein